MQCFQHRLRMLFGDTQQGTGGALGAAVALLPVLQGADADADESGELTLRQPQFLAHGLCVRPLMGALPGGFLFATQYGAALFDAGDELLEELIVHGNSFLTRVFKSLIWSAVRSSCLFFG